MAWLILPWLETLARCSRSQASNAATSGRLFSPRMRSRSCGVTPLLRLLASATGHRWPNYPDVKTLRELGYDAANLVPPGFACPSPVPPDIRTRLERAVALAAPDPELQATMRSLTIRPRAMSGAEFFAALKSQAPTVENILVAAGMKKT
jgi:tripartite-type tricarboxylate transporter receptor subunit TctC